MVYTNYRPKTHNIKALYTFVNQQSDELKAVFPQTTKLSHRSFQLLKKTYIEARYSDQYEIQTMICNGCRARVGVKNTD